ncbi:acyl-CoA dehydrogenase family protein [Dactylosporangium sp. NPDC005572]|uniref:acyl-CoA dehydrogenase family protein n=1 Tax=Dactylosporangium sp. NPDC005572 TaxID=3156889 RepID=UPI0033A61A1D
MDFSTVELTDETREFRRDVSEFLDVHLNEAVLETERRTGAGHSQPLHRALASRGWVQPTWPVDEGGAGLDPLQNRILQLELADRDAPMISSGTTRIVVGAVRSYGSPWLKEQVLPAVAAGEVICCLGYTEPDGGSDLAGVRTGAVRDGTGWVINGAKMFTTGAQHCQYCFLVTRTNTEVPKHKGITTFLVPLDRAGIEIRPIETLGGERTNAVFYTDVRIEDDYRLGPVDQGWKVLSGPLSDEHGLQRGDAELDEINGQGAGYRATLDRLFRHALHWALTAGPDGSRPYDEPFVQLRLAEIATDLEIARSTPGAMGRVNGSELLIRDSALLVDLVGPTAVLPHGATGASEDGLFEWGHRYAQGTATYGGTTDIMRNIVAQRVLGLPRPPRFDG